MSSAPECPFCGQSPCVGQQPLLSDNACFDETDGAHPAWWRGHRNGGAGVARALFRVAREGLIPGARFGASEVQEAADAIGALRRELAAERAKNQSKPT